MGPSNLEFSAETGHPRKYQILAIMCSCLILVVAGVSSLNIAIPSIIADLEPSQTQTLWIIDSYALVFAGLLLPAGALGDRYGRKGALLIGLAIFAAGAIWSSYSDSANALIVARGSMGIGAALIMPATLSILVSVFPVTERAKAIAIWAGFAGAGGAIGIIGGGALLETFWWGSVFFINVPIAIVAALMISFVVPTSRDGNRLPLDPVGALLSIAGLGTLVYAIIDAGEHGWVRGATFGWFAFASVMLIGWLRWELTTEHPMLDPRLFRRTPFGLGSLTISASFAVMFGMFFIITLYFQFARGLSPLAAGVRVLPFAGTMLVVAPRSPMIAARLGKRGVMTIGLVTQAIAFVVLARVTEETAYIFVAIALALLATGMALIMPAGSEAIVSSLPPSKAGVASAVNDTTREVGGALGIAVLGSLLATGYRSGIEDLTRSLPPELADTAGSGIGGAFQVAERTDRPELVQPAIDAFIDGMHLAFWVAAAASVVTAVLVFVRYPTRGNEPEPVSETVSTGSSV